MAPSKTSKLFQPISVGNMQLQNRVVMAPLTRFRADDNHVHHDIAVEYYAQRASVPGTLIVTEATFISEDAGGFDNAPGIWSDEQVKAWKKVTDAVHAKGSFIFVQLWALGRAAVPKVLAKTGHEVVAPSPIPVDPKKKPPRALTLDEIQAYIAKYTQAAKNAVLAGFDGVEVHGANGYLIDQFIQSTSNVRTDAYGGSIENRTRFALEVVKSVTAAIGERRVAIRLSPWSRFQGMGMPDPIPTFSALISALSTAHSSLAYLSLVEPRVQGDDDRLAPSTESNEFAYKLWAQPKVLLTAGWTSDPEGAAREADERGILAGFGRAFIANPDLAYRLQNGIKLNPYDRSTFYTRGPKATKGYIDYPFAEKSKL